MKISIAMCTYNGARFLSEQLDSVENQSRRPDEIVICDDGSSDNTLEILNSFADSSSIPVRIHQNTQRLGSTKNFEQAIDLCTGDLIALCDQDDVWDLRKLAAIEKLLQENGDVDLVFTDAELVNENGQSLGRTLSTSLGIGEVEKLRIRSSVAYELLDQREIVTGATMVFRSKFKKLVLPIAEGLPLIHDGWIALMISHTGKLELIDQALIQYRQHSYQQIGAPEEKVAPEPGRGIIESARRVTDFTTQLRIANAVLDRMKVCDGAFEFKGKDYLQEMVKHLETREHISGLAQMIGEMSSGRYHRYSNGWKSFFKDLLNKWS